MAAYKPPAVSVQEFVNCYIQAFAPEGLQAAYPELIKSTKDARAFRAAIGWHYNFRVIGRKGNPRTFGWAIHALMLCAAREGSSYRLDTKQIFREMKSMDSKLEARERVDQ